MISDWKKGIRILRHTYLKGYDMANGVFWMISGLILMLAGLGELIYFSSVGCLVLCTGLWWTGSIALANMIKAVEGIGVIAASPKRKLFSLDLSDWFMAVSGLFWYFVHVLTHYLNQNEISNYSRFGEYPSNSVLFIVFVQCFIILILAGVFWKKNLCFLVTGINLFALLLNIISEMILLKWVLKTDFGKKVNVFFTEKLLLEQREVYLLGLGLIVFGLVLNMLLRRKGYRVQVSKRDIRGIVVK